MIKLFIPMSKGKIKNNVRGLWLNDSHKLFYDYLKIVNTSYIEPSQLKALKKKYNQESIFSYDTLSNWARIYYNRDRIELLGNKIYKEILKVNLKTEIKEALRQYSGCTIYIEAGRYYIEIFYK